MIAPRNPYAGFNLSRSPADIHRFGNWGTVVDEITRRREQSLDSIQNAGLVCIKQTTTTDLVKGP